MKGIKTLSHIALAAITLLLNVNLSAQVLDPVVVSPVIQPPYSIYLSNYFIAGQERFALNLTFNDFNEPSLDVRLKLTIEGQGIRLTTTPNFNANPITIYPGANSIDAQDVRPYFNFNNLNVAGISKQQLQQTGALPEGFYTFCIEVIDHQSGKEVSNIGCTSATLIRNMPPMLITPIDEGFVPAQDPQNLLFQWQPISDVAVNTTYELTLVHVPAGINPNDAVNATNTPLLDAEPVMSPVFYYGPDQLPLEVGQRYAWRVRAKDANEIAVFENNGQSQVSSFIYGFPLNGTIALQQPQDSMTIDPASAYLQWAAPSNAQAGTALTYKIRVTQIQAGQDAEQALNNATVYSDESPLINHLSGYSATPTSALAKGETYAWQVIAEVQGIEVARSNAGVFQTTPDVDKIYAGNHQLIVKSIVNGDKNHFSGTGSIKLFEGEGDYDVNFSDLKIKKVAGKWVLDGGKLEHTINNKRVSIPIENHSRNGVFVAQKALIQKQGLRMNGHMEIPVVFGNDSALMVSDTATAVFDNYSPAASFSVASTQPFFIGGADGFQYAFTEGATVNTGNNNARFNLSGNLRLPLKITGANSEPVVFRFEELNKLNAFDESAGTFENRISIYGSAISINPTQFEFDFKTDASPGEKSAEPEWQGFEIQSFELVHDFPENHSTRLQMDIKAVSYNKSALNGCSAFADQNGLTFMLQDAYTTITGSNYARFTHPVATLTNVNIEVVESTMRTGEIKGHVVVSEVSAAKAFGFTVPLNDTAESYLHLDKISGGDHVVTLNRTSTAFDDQGRLSGTAQFIVNPQDSAYSGNIENVLLAVSGESLVISEGEVLAQVGDFDVQIDHVGAEVDYTIAEARVTSQGLFVKSTPADFETGLTTASGPLAVKFKTAWFDFNSFKINGMPILTTSISGELLDPMGFMLYIDSSSLFEIKDNAFSYSAKGYVELPASVKNIENENVKLAFENQDDFSYLVFETEGTSVAIALAKGTKINASPTSIIVDLSEAKSPVHLSGDKMWKGAYFEKFKLVLPENFDNAGRLTNDVAASQTVVASDKQYVFISGSGLNAQIELELPATISDANYAAYNHFNGKLSGFVLHIEDNQLEHGHIAANLFVPVINQNSPFEAIVPINTNNLGTGYFTKNIEGAQNTFLQGKDMEVTLTVNEANFNPNNLLALNIDLDFPGYDITLSNLDNFVVSGEGGVGFNKLNATLWLQNQVTGSVGNGAFPFTAKKVKAYEIDNDVYGFEVTGTMVVAENLSSPAGEIESTFTSFFTDALKDNPLYSFAANEHGELTKLDIGTPIAIPAGPVTFESKFVYTKDDPIYGNSVQTYAAAKLKVPVPFTALVQVIVGETSGYNYWFVRASADLAVTPPSDSTLASLQAKAAEEAAKDPNNLQQDANSNKPAVEDKPKFDGIPIGPIKLTGFEGRIYHHMNHKEGGGITDADYIPDPNVAFGIYVRVACKDTEKNGGQFIVNGSVEATFKGESLNTIAISADVLIGNSTGVGQTTNSTVKAGGSISMHIPNKHFNASLYATSSDPKFCASGTLEIDIKPDAFLLKVGTEDQMISIVPGCRGWGFMGFVEITDKKVDVAAGVSLSAEFDSEWKHIGVAMVKANAKVGVAAGVRAELEYNPEVKLNRAGLWIVAWGTVTVGAQFPAFDVVPLHNIKQNLTLELASIKLRGQADIYFQDPKRLVGTFDGKVTILESATFDFKVQGEIPLT